MGEEAKALFPFPEDMPHDELMAIVHELLGGDIGDVDIRGAFESGMFQELCPDIAKYAANRRREAGCSSSQQVKDEAVDTALVPELESTHHRSSPSHEEETNSRDSHANEIKLSDSESNLSKHRHQHKKKKKRSKDHKRDKDDKKDNTKEKDMDSDKKSKREDGDKIKEKERDREKHKEKDKDRDRHKEKEKERDKHKEKDRDRHKEKESDKKDRHNEKEKDREKVKSSKEKGSRREEDIHREKDKEKHKDKHKQSESKLKSNKEHHNIKKEIMSDSDSDSKLHVKKKVTVKKESSDSEEDNRKRDEKSENQKKHKKKKRRVVYFSSSSSSESSNSSRGDSNQKSKDIHSKSNDKHAKSNSAKIKTEPEEKPKVHPFYQEKHSGSFTQKRESVVPPDKFKPDKPRDKSSDKNLRDRDREHDSATEKKKEPKPFSKYNSCLASSSLRKWKPHVDKEHARYQRRFGLRSLSILCVDLLDMPTLFHKPYSHQSTPFSVPLDPTMILSDSKISLIKKLESSQTFSFKSQLKRKAAKSIKQNRHSHRDDYSDDNRKIKRAKIMDRIVSSGNSSDSSSVMIPTSSRKAGVDKGGRRGGKLSKSERDAEARKRKIDEVKRKAEKFSARGTRVLPWENKDEYFKNKTKEEKEVDPAVADRKRKQEQIKKVKLLQQKNAPSTSFQRILAQIEAANKAETRKGEVKLKIPKLSSQSGPPKEYKVDGKINCSDVAKEVTRLLSSDVKVECPVMADTLADMGEYTVRKIGWWFLKNEKDPPHAGPFHPELHDDDDQFEPSLADDFDWPDDMSSINGCVSDPEGLSADVPPDPKKLKDADWADDYCGQASLYAEIRRTYDPDSKGTRPPEPKDAFGGFFKGFLRIKPGTNYEKENFEAKCFLCNQIIMGQRNLGAHIRSNGHKNNFRNYSLTLASYEEKVQPAIPKKEFIARLVEYSVNASSSTYERRDESEEHVHQIAKIESARSDSPRPLIGGETGVEVHEMPLPDEISLPSIQDYDISSDESLQQVRVYLRTKTDYWTSDLERRWRQRIDEETKIAQLYNTEREYFIQEPERHPKYQEEWTKFWEQTNNELEAEGIDPDTYDFHKSWLPFWLKRMQEIMKKEVEYKVDENKRNHLIDKHSLRNKYGVPVELTCKQKKKSRDGYNTSTIKSGDKSTSDANEQKHSSANKPNNDRSKFNHPHPPTSPVSSVEEGEVTEFKKDRERSHKHKREHDRHRSKHHHQHHHKSKHSRHHHHQQPQRFRDHHQNQQRHRDHGPSNSFTNCDNDGYDVPQPISVIKTRAY